VKVAGNKHRKATGFMDQGAAPFTGLPVVGSGGAASITATEAKNRFGELLDMARREPVQIQKNGRAVAVMLSPEEYRRLIDASTAPKVRPLVDQLLEKSIQRRRSLYEALAR
jgi:prevent-host-death family protein